MNLNTYYEQGLTKEEYINLLTDHKEGFLNVFNNFKLPDDLSFFKQLKTRKLRAIVIAEPWCGHCMFNIPIIFRLAEKIKMPVHTVLRDQNLDLIDQYLTNGKSRSVPIFIFIDETGNQVAKWGPTTPNMQKFISIAKEKLPAKESNTYTKEFNKFIQILSKSFKEDSKFWDDSYQSIKSALINKEV